MKITNVTVGKSIQVFQVGQPEYWNKISMTANVEEQDDPQEVVDALFKDVNKAHQKYSQSEISNGKNSGDIFFNVSTQKEER